MQCEVNHSGTSPVRSQESSMFQTTCLRSGMNCSPNGRFEAGNEATSEQNILLSIDQVDLFHVFNSNYSFFK